MYSTEFDATSIRPVAPASDSVGQQHKPKAKRDFSHG